MSPKNYPPHIVDEGASYQQKVEEAPYHPGYEDAVINKRSDPVYKGMDPAKMIWKSRPLSEEEIYEIWCESNPTEYLPEVRLKDGSLISEFVDFVRSIEERHGIK